MAKIPTGMRKKENGLYEKRFTIDGKRYSAYGHTIAECLAEEAEKREKIKSGLYASSKNIKLNSYYDEWEKARIGVVKNSTIDCNRNRYDVHIKPALGSKKVQNIEKRDITALQKKLCKTLCPSMVNLIIGTLKNVLNGAVEDEIISRNPALTVKPIKDEEREKASENIHRALTKEEQIAFMSEAKNEWLYEFYAFALCTGMRLGEMASLTWSDIDYINNVIHVTKNLSWKSGGGVEITAPKSKKSKRDIPMNDTIKKILQSQREKLEMVYGHVFAHSMDKNVFVGLYGSEQLASATIGYSIEIVLRRLAEKGVIIDKFTCHAFRHTFATRYIEEGGNMQTLKTLLGHSSLQMTADLYSHVLPNTRQQEMEQIENAFIGIV